MVRSPSMDIGTYPRFIKLLDSKEGFFIFILKWFLPRFSIMRIGHLALIILMYLLIILIVCIRERLRGLSERMESVENRLTVLTIYRAHLQYVTDGFWYQHYQTERGPFLTFKYVHEDTRLGLHFNSVTEDTIRCPTDTIFVSLPALRQKRALFRQSMSDSNPTEKAARNAYSSTLL